MGAPLDIADIADSRASIDKIETGAIALALALRGPEGRKISRRELMRATMVVVDAQIELAQGARSCLDALEHARAIIEKQRT